VRTLRQLPCSLSLILEGENGIKVMVSNEFRCPFEVLTDVAKNPASAFRIDMEFLDDLLGHTWLPRVIALVDPTSMATAGHAVDNLGCLNLLELPLLNSVHVLANGHLDG
jgi:hypothetical protein